jgi:endogenous inhibitor of DNA gyrase (YacG/DUF329 family)
MIDLGAWASESYRVGSPSADNPEAPGSLGSTGSVTDR